ncbi:ankyrin repeat domain-containing 28 [Fusarium albosuccineum]|uniref:Ankyrin repeat domain-containing 28 n=1 Tax=Fusarium albosuccineum TaxID=1237068 RepID=A0A8H4L4D6_9HYPO|nr:ankyrin repeat domain-containing 28 [Fusarium albosuccineum]
MNLFLWLCVVALSLAICVSADAWDDFSNNLATDLAPIISLFGEQVTKQYLSESITWLDYFIFAMAPIGVLTALVSAIRVCGSSSLRAFIGRAKEGEGYVEAELLSPTSHDVCELYNNGGIARIFGRPRILEIVYDPNAPDSEFTSPSGTAGISTFEQYCCTKNGRKEWRNQSRSIRDADTLPPNLSHNVGIIRPDDWWFVLVAILGFILQGGVLAFATCATYYFRWEKNEKQPEAYACPMAITGTVLVCGATSARLYAGYNLDKLWEIKPMTPSATLIKGL